MSSGRKAEAFIDLLIAAMTDAAVSRNLSQLKTTITPEGTTKAHIVRIIIVPESMDYDWPQGLQSKPESKGGH